MKRIHCTGCGSSIRKSALHDPYICRDCEHQQLEELGKMELSRYSYLDNA